MKTEEVILNMVHKGIRLLKNNPTKDKQIASLIRKKSFTSLSSKGKATGFNG